MKPVLALAALLAGCAPVVVVQPFAFDLPLCDGRFQVANLSGSTLRRLDAWPPGTDLLGATTTLPPGTEAAVSAPPRPLRLRATLADGRVLALDGFDPCAAALLRVTDGGLRPQ